MSARGPLKYSCFPARILITFSPMRALVLLVPWLIFAGPGWAREKKARVPAPAERSR